MKGSPADFDLRNDDRSLLDNFLDKRVIEPHTERQYEVSWGLLNDFIETEGIDITEINERHAAKFCDFLKQQEPMADNTARNHVSRLKVLVGWYCDRGVLDYNPFAMVMDDSPFDTSSETVKKEIALDDLRESLHGQYHPATLTLIVLLLKTGLRIGEAVNLDYRDVYLNHPISGEMDSPRAELADKPDTLFVDSSISEGEVHNGELRGDGNKPYSTRAVPIDDELKETLVWYIAMSPPSPSDANPLFRKPMRPTGGRFATVSIRQRYFQNWTKQNGWHDPDRSDSITPHWCRHWFTTMLRRRIDQDEIEMGSVENYVQGLRGDTGYDVIETYTHNWGDNQWMRDAYINNIPSLFPD